MTATPGFDAGIQDLSSVGLNQLPARSDQESFTFREELHL
jgi:hypothetical protein